MSKSCFYNKNLVDISYNDDFEYRNILLDLFFIENGEDFNTIYEKQDIIYEQTKNILIFQEFYDLAAARIISTDRLVGLSVLFSYNLLPYFHKVLCSFLLNEEINTYDIIRLKENI
jgi:hypothetical protein